MNTNICPTSTYQKLNSQRKQRVIEPLPARRACRRRLLPPLHQLHPRRDARHLPTLHDSHSGLNRQWVRGDGCRGKCNDRELKWRTRPYRSLCGDVQPDCGCGASCIRAWVGFGVGVGDGIGDGCDGCDVCGVMRFLLMRVSFVVAIFLSLYSGS